jgi:hypothetical protein
MAREVNEFDQIIDSRDVIARMEELDSELEDAYGELPDNEGVDEKNQLSYDDWLQHVADDSSHILNEEAEEFLKLQGLADEAQSNVSDWEHGATLIREDHFVEYTQELLKEIGDLPQDLPNYLVIDWDATADNIKADYSEVEFAGVTYLARS